MSEVRSTAMACECVKHAFRQTQDGVVISFVIHPNDVPDGLALAPLGTRYQIALVQVGDNEQPQKPPRKMHSLPQRVGMWCENELFQTFLVSRNFIQDRSQTAEYVRQHCKVGSRSQIMPGTPAAERWDNLLAEYERWQRGDV